VLITAIAAKISPVTEALNLRIPHAQSFQKVSCASAILSAKGFLNFGEKYNIL
jgi:hypothetical protein